MGFRLWLVLAVWGVLTGRALCSLGLTLENQVIIPELTGAPNRVELVDINHDGLRELLVSDGQSVILYSPQLDSTIFAFTCYGSATDVRCLFADVTGDSIPDLVVGQYFAYLLMPPDTVCRVDLFDGASRFSAHDSTFFTVNRLINQPLLPPTGMVSLSVIDADHDGFDNLRVSFHKYSIHPFGGTSRLTTTGESIIFRHFPDDTLYSNQRAVDWPMTIGLQSGDSLTALTRYTTILVLEPGAGTFSSTVESSLNFVDDSGTIVKSLVRPLYPPCSGDSTAMTSSYRAIALGNIDITDSLTTELLVEYSAKFHCNTDGSVPFDSLVNYYELYHLLPSDSLAFGGYLSGLEGLSNIRYVSAYPGHLFATENRSVLSVRTLTGQRDVIGEIPNADTLFWSHSGGNDSVAIVIAVEGKVISIYRIDQVTDVADSPAALPSSFSLGTVYPNPFNAVLSIPVSTSGSGRILIEILNVMGQPVTKITDRLVSGGQYTYRWDASKFSSGVYFIRVDFRGITKTAKAILLK